MIGFLNLTLCIFTFFMVLNSSECQVTVSNLNGAGKFLCGHRTLLQCYVPAYGGGMSWKLDGTIIAQCAFGSCTALGALPSGDIFTYDETAKTFNLNISITHADNGTMYQCDDGANQNQTTVNIQVPPSESAFTTAITETNTSITVEAGCFYPSNAGIMDVYCVSDGKKVGAALPMTPTTTGCTGDCAGPNIYTAVGSYAINSSNTGGNSMYRFKVYHKDFNQTQYTVSIDSSANYTCGLYPTTPTPPPPGCGETCIIIIVVCVVVLLIIIIIVCLCIRKRNKKKDTNGHNLSEKNDKKQDQINIPSEEYVNNEKYGKEQDQNKEEHKF